MRHSRVGGSRSRSTPVGWRNESYRHYLAAKGVRTSRYFARVRSVPEAFDLYDMSLAKKQVQSGMNTRNIQNNRRSVRVIVDRVHDDGKEEIRKDTKLLLDSLNEKYEREYPGYDPHFDLVTDAEYQGIAEIKPYDVEERRLSGRIKSVERELDDLDEDDY